MNTHLFFNFTQVIIITFSFTLLSAAETGQPQEEIVLSGEESSEKPEQTQKILEELKTTKPFATSILKRGESLKDYPIRVDLFRPDRKNILLHWSTDQEVDFKYLLIQEGRLTHADEEKQEFTWKTLQALQGKLNQWRIQPDEEETQSQKYLRIVGVPRKGAALFSYPTIYLSAPLLPSHSQIRLYADRVESRSIQISWTPPATAGTDAVVIERSQSTSGPWRQAGLLAHGGRIFQDRFLDPNTEYHYRVRSTNEDAPWQSESLRVRTLR